MAKRIAGVLPPQAWDSHMHVVDPEKYPVVADAPYVPPVHSLAQARAFESSIGIPNIVLVQPSIYGFDNSCVLDALRAVGPEHGRAVVAIDPTAIRPETLDEWHRLGVRGVRVNLQSVGKQLSPAELADSLRRHADAIRPWNWVLQLYVSMDTVPHLLDVVPRLGVRVCFDHFASPDLRQVEQDTAAPFDPYSLPGFPALVSLLTQGNTYVKISAHYRLSDDPEMRCVRLLAQELMRVARHRVVFATDWPHTRFDGLDITPFVEACRQWCDGDRDLEERLFRRNAEDLWDVRRDESA
ncbi:hypothetical protein VTO42DRAFT_6173 [Malbranchea cinnamomea]